jgi:hypothetical protein
MNASLRLGRVSVVLALTVCPCVGVAQDNVPWGISAFVSQHGDTISEVRVVGQLDTPPFTLFSAGPNVGVKAGDRIGWLRQPADLWGPNRVADTLVGPEWFDLRAGDSAIAATAVDPRLAGAPGVQLRVWRTIVAQSVVTPLATLLALVKADQTLGPAVGTNPRLADTTSPVPALLALAEANDQVAAVVIANPVFAEQPRALATLAESHPGVWHDAMERVLEHLGALTASGPIDERLAIHLATASWMLGADSTRAAVAALPAVRQSSMARTILALAADTNLREPPPSVSEVGIRELIGRFYADTAFEPWLPPSLAGALVRSRAVRADHTLLWTLGTLCDKSRVGRQRWRDLRTDVLRQIVWDNSPLEDLERVARALADPAYWEHRQFPPLPRRVPALYVQPRSEAGHVARLLVNNPRVWHDRTVLASLATLPAAEFGGVPAIATQHLQMAARGQ